MKPILEAGTGDRLGAIPGEYGVNFAVFSANATAIDLCLFDGVGAETRLPLTARTGDVWHGFAPGVGAGQAYGYRAYGPWAPDEGHLFNPAKLLIDPYARAVDRRIVWHPAMTGSHGGVPDRTDSAPYVAKSLVVADTAAAVPPPGPPDLIWEAHAKGLTRLMPDLPDDLRGTWGALLHPPLIAHMKRIGVTHLELLPIAAFIDDRHVRVRGLSNYWGYQPVAPFAAEPRYQGTGPGIGAVIRGLAEQGIGVILDVVFNHTGEGDAAGPTLSFRGLDNKSYYRLHPGGSNVNDAGTGNTLNLAHPMVLRLVLDALRHWAGLGVAGFRFDLAVTLLRDGSQFLDMLLADPLLGRLILIAEPWDVGPDGYRLGRFPPPFLEWNDRFRDDVRRFWRGDGRAGDLARRLAGSAELFDRPGRSAASSVNYLAAHDGFTLRDLVSYAGRHNLANGEGNRDGHADNCSDNFGTEGPTADPAICAARAARVQAMLATLFVAQGTPMLLAGDEGGRTQGGNNNAYAQDNETGWLDWGAADGELTEFVARLSDLRRRYPVLRQPRFLHGDRASDGTRDLVWRLASGQEPRPQDWDAPGLALIGMELRAAGAAEGGALYAVFNNGPESDILLPDGDWWWELDSADPARIQCGVAGRLRVAAGSVQIFTMAG
ncbi:MAG: glycogen debranching protein GlgX [Paracoccaceae bacterium]